MELLNWSELDINLNSDSLPHKRHSKDMMSYVCF